DKLAASLAPFLCDQHITILLSFQLMLSLVVLSVCQVEVEEGVESVQLPFKTTPYLLDATKVKWKRYVPSPAKTVHMYQHGSDQPKEQSQVYRDRTEMNKDLLETGDFSLTLKNPKHTDTGSYRCTVCNRRGEVVRLRTVQLEVKGQYEDTGQRSVFVSVSGCFSPSNCPLSPLQREFRPKMKQSGPEDVTAAVTAARDLMQLILTEKLCLRAEFLQYSRQITLDPNTANTHLILSEENRKVTFNDKGTPYPHHPDRFTDTPQVLSKEGLTGRCYWEVEKKKSWNVGVAVAYKSVDRSLTSLSSGLGQNKESWSLLCCCDGSYTFYHDGQQTFISGPVPSRIGVYLDHSAGILSFYSISSDTMRLLHRKRETLCAPGGDNSAPSVLKADLPLDREFLNRVPAFPLAFGPSEQAPSQTQNT
uniref:B30.2/SPRY domain-containing protein n=1 Tax=Sparus aurata TaxID=8175 RepID=A0A671TQ22_SPAAU